MLLYIAKLHCLLVYCMWKLDLAVIHCFQAPAIGRAMMEFIIDDNFQTIDLNRFMFDRFIDEEPVFEEVVS